MIAGSEQTVEILGRKDREFKSKTEVYETVLGVPTYGIQFKLYSTTDYAGLNPTWSQEYPNSEDESGVFPNMSLYWGSNAPLNLTLERYKLSCSGYFYVANDATDLYFEFVGDGDIDFEFNYNTILISGYSSLSISKDVADFYYSEAIDVSGEQGNWFPFVFNIQGKNYVNKYGGIVIRYRYDDKDSTVLNAGVVNSTPNFITPYTVPTIEIDGEHTKGSSSVYRFSAPLSSATHAEGFYYDDTGDYYLDHSGNVLKEGYTVCITAGYKVDADPTPRTVGTYSGGYEMLPRFTGFINSINADRNSEKLEVECFGFDEIPNNSISRNYPDPSSYWNFGYFHKFNSKEPDGQSMPIAYDKWNISNAIEDLFMKSGLPASLMHGVKYFQNSGYALLPDSAMVDYGYNLDWNIDYASVNSETEFLYGDSFGDKVLDVAMNFVDSYGMFYRFNNEGYLELRQANNPRFSYSDKSTGKNMLRDPDFSLGLNELYGAAVVDTNEYNLGSASMNIDGVGYALFNPVNLMTCSNPMNNSFWYYASFYGKNTSANPSSVRVQFWKLRSDGTYEMVSPVKWKIIPALTSSWTRYNVFFYNLSAEDAQLYIGTPNPNLTWPVFEDTWITDVQLETGELTDFEMPVRATNLDAIGGSYLVLQVSGSGTTKYIQGEGLSLVMQRSPWAGVGDNSNDPLSGSPSIRVDVEEYARYGSTLQATGNSASYNINPYYTSERDYFDGIDPATGENPCVINLSSDLFAGYSDYKVSLTKIVSGYTCHLDSIWVYDKKTDKSDYTIDSTVDVKRLSYQSDLRNRRNDILVVGQRKGVWVGEKEEPLNVVADRNLKNVVYTNYHSRALDLDGIYNPNNSRWIGRSSAMYIQEPNIVNQERANWVSVNVLDALRSRQTKPSFSVTGNPLLEIGDCITVDDQKDHSVKGWVVGINEKISSNDWDMTAEVSTFEPWPSYQRFEDFDPADFGGHFAINVTVKDTDGYERSGDSTALDGAHNAVSEGDTDDLTVDSTAGFPDSGVVLVYKTSSPIYGKYVYTSKTSTTFSGTWVYINAPTSVDFPADCVVTNSYNPYEVDECGVYIKLSFDMIVACKVRVGVKETSSTVGAWISGITKGGVLVDGDPDWDKFASGEHVELIWGGIDQSGTSHPEEVGGNPNPLHNKKDYFAYDKEYHFQIDLIRLDTEEQETRRTFALDSEYDNSASEVVTTLRSPVDDVFMEIVYNDPNKTDELYIPNASSGSTYNIEDYGNVSGSKFGKYAQNRGQLAPNLGTFERDTKNYLYAQSEGPLRFNLANSNTNSARSYKISVQIFKHEMKYRVWGDYLSSGHSTHAQTRVEVDPLGTDVSSEIANNMYNDGEFLDVDYNGRELVFNLESSRWGGYNIDSRIADLRVSCANGNEGLFYARAFVVRLLFVIQDKSGRIVRYVSSQGSTTTVVNNYEVPIYDEIDSNQQMANIVAEIWPVPRDIDLEIIDNTNEPAYPPSAYAVEARADKTSATGFQFEPSYSFQVLHSAFPYLDDHYICHPVILVYNT